MAGGEGAARWRLWREDIGTLGVAERSDGGSGGRSPMEVVAEGYRDAGGRRAQRWRVGRAQPDGGCGGRISGRWGSPSAAMAGQVGAARWRSLRRDIGTLGVAERSDGE